MDRDRLYDERVDQVQQGAEPDQSGALRAVAIPDDGHQKDHDREQVAKVLALHHYPWGILLVTGTAAFGLVDRDAKART